MQFSFEAAFEETSVSDMMKVVWEIQTGNKRFQAMM